MKKTLPASDSSSRRDFLKRAGLAPAVVGLASLPGESATKDEYPNLAELRAAREKQGIIPPNKTESAVRAPPHGKTADPSSRSARPGKPWRAGDRDSG